MKRPAFQFYPSDWASNSNLRRCSWAARGVWIEVMGLMHDSDRYGTLAWPLKEIAQALGCPLSLLKELVDKGVMKGTDKGAVDAHVFIPRSGRKEGPPVVLVPASHGPLWFSSRMVKDEYLRTVRGAGTRFGDESSDAPKPTPKPAPKGGLGEGSSDGPSSSSSSSSSEVREGSTPSSSVPEPARAPIDDDDDGKDPVSIAHSLCRQAGVSVASPKAIATAAQLVRDWQQAGATPDLMSRVIADALPKSTEPISSLRYFDKTIRHRIALEANGHGSTLGGHRESGTGAQAPGGELGRMAAAVAAVRAERLAGA